MSQLKTPKERRQVLGVVKPFRNGGSLAIRLPASETSGIAEWVIERLEDGRLLLEPVREKKTAGDLLRRFAALKADWFPEGRESLELKERKW